MEGVNGPCPSLRLREKYGKLVRRGLGGESQEGRRLDRRWVLLLEGLVCPVKHLDFMKGK